MASHIASSLDAIILGVNAQLMSVTGFPQERVLVTDVATLDFHPHGDQYLILWPDDEAAVISDVSGSGRINAQAIDTFDVYIRTRFAVDESSRSLTWLTDTAAGLGHIKLRHSIWNALVDFQVQDGSSNILCFPIMPGRGTRPGKGWRSTAKNTQKREAGKFASGRATPLDKSWGESILTFNVRYQLALDTSVFV